MKTKGFILILAAAFLLPLNAEAQLGSKLKKKLEEKVSKALGTEIAGEAEEAQNDEQEADKKCVRIIRPVKAGYRQGDGQSIMSFRVISSSASQSEEAVSSCRLY
ncbi:MAG: hypothetical protein GX622_10080 [Bacteroidales bacterium]|nr:hypothetical protein [Bacteroidales bacterium]